MLLGLLGATALGSYFVGKKIKAKQEAEQREIDEKLNQVLPPGGKPGLPGVVYDPSPIMSPDPQVPTQTMMPYYDPDMPDYNPYDDEPKPSKKQPSKPSQNTSNFL